jgi:hypothetical protein
MYIKCWFYMMKYTFCIKNEDNTIECAFYLGENKLIHCHLWIFFLTS